MLLRLFWVECRKGGTNLRAYSETSLEWLQFRTKTQFRNKLLGRNYSGGGVDRDVLK
jgi:hypothetical protein